MKMHHQKFRYTSRISHIQKRFVFISQHVIISNNSIIIYYVEKDTLKRWYGRIF